MARHYADWLKAFLAYSDHVEAPRFMRFWAGVGAVAGALRRKVWVDNFYFRWFPNFFIIFVAPPGIVTKSTTADLAMDLLREVPGIRFGPNAITWQALATAFSNASEHFQLGEEWHPMSAITLASRELGSLLNPKDQDLVSLFIELWDGAKKYEKETKMSGNDLVEAPWVNLLGATTPSWIADNMPASMIGGGFVSRCVFLYADQKEKMVAYPKLTIPHDIEKVRQNIVADLEHIAVHLTGEYIIEPAALEWGKAWYETMWTAVQGKTDDDQVMGYIARKQAHAHKLAMVLSASHKDELTISLDDLQLAVKMLDDLEADMAKVFSRIGQSQSAVQAEKFASLLRRVKELPYTDAYRLVHAHFPDFSGFEDVLNGLIRSGQLTMENRGDGIWLVAK